MKEIKQVECGIIKQEVDLAHGFMPKDNKVSYEGKWFSARSL